MKIFQTLTDFSLLLRIQLKNKVTLDQKDKSEIEEKIAIVDEWFKSFNAVAEGAREISEIDRKILREVLTYYGADFETHNDSEREAALKKLKQPTNKWRRPGMDAVWGEVYINNYNRWTKDWANAYEEKTGKSLPKLDESGSKVSGMRHWLGELTSYTAGAMTFDQFRERQSARLLNGFARATGGVLRKVTFLPDDKDLPGSVPPGFVKDAWEKVKSQTLKTPLKK